MWGYVEGGMGMVSFILCDAARDAGAVVATGVRSRGSCPARGSSSRGRADRAPVVVSNADPRVTLRLLGDAADPAWRARVEAIPMTGCTVKLNVALRELPDFTARPGTRRAPPPRPDQHAADQGRVAGSIRGRPRRPAARPALDRALFPDGARPERRPRGRAHDERFRPVRAAHVRRRATGRPAREEVNDLALASIARFCENIPEAVLDVQVLGPPDIEREVGLTGGHIFQGECLPTYMWDRGSRRTPMPGVFLCGACTHPGGSVIAVNGRNAAMEILGAFAS